MTLPRACSSLVRALLTVSQSGPKRGDKWSAGLAAVSERGRQLSLWAPRRHDDHLLARHLSCADNYSVRGASCRMQGPLGQDRGMWRPIGRKILQPDLLEPGTGSYGQQLARLGHVNNLTGGQQQWPARSAAIKAADFCTQADAIAIGGKIALSHTHTQTQSPVWISIFVQI